MITDVSRVLPLLKNLSLFNSLDEGQVAQIASFFTLINLTPDEVVLSQGKKADAFYIIVEGNASVERMINKDESQVDVFVLGDFFGEDSLLQDTGEPTTVSALTPLTLLRLDKDHFRVLIHEFPSVGDRLNRFVKSHQYQKNFQFDWLNEDEVVYQVRRRHIAYLALMLILPAMVIFLGLVLFGVAFFVPDSAFVRDGTLIVTAVILGIGIGWLVWNVIDWGNDYYLITNQRVVWIEKVIGLYDSRIEAPLNTILSVNVSTLFIGRILGYGDVIVTTFTGKVLLQTVSNPYQLAGLISEYWQRSQQDLQRSDIKEIRKSVKRILGGGEETSEVKPAIAKSKGGERRPDQVTEPSIWDKYFGNIFKTRIEDGKTITYRKHWLILLRKTWIPTLFALILLFLVATFDIMYVLGDLKVVSPVIITTLAFVILFILLLPWWLYHYVDWRNDIYQVTDRSIFDIERKPFGTESRKSAALENILSLEHERPGFIGYLLNVGFVTIMVGETKFTFDNVYQPARVQQDVFNHMHALRIQKQKEEVARERERILKMIEIYHEEIGKDL
jgi:Cyclic nucleotide-binding domain